LAVLANTGRGRYFDMLCKRLDSMVAAIDGYLTGTQHCPAFPLTVMQI
jgi:hypothetical protein